MWNLVHQMVDIMVVALPYNEKKNGVKIKDWSPTDNKNRSSFKGL